MSREDGGPAFPCEFVQHQRGEVGNNTPIMARSSGMTLRDYFAAEASDEDVREAAESVFGTDGSKYPINWRQVARFAHADAMLAARKENTR